ncbi:MAG: tyrosine-type recombinase/integrase [Actinomycetota bacterium]|nr:tyrosine-type recombinase/integrase [Actinomycetota bacterium]
MPRIRFHDFRHTFATFLLAEGTPARVVMELHGHWQIGITMNTHAPRLVSAFVRERGRSRDPTRRGSVMERVAMYASTRTPSRTEGTR